MGVPAHDQRDFEFANKHNLSYKKVIESPNNPEYAGNDRAYEGEGVLVESGEYNGLKGSEARDKLFASLTEKKIISKLVNYRLRDWLVSRQR